MILAPYPEGVPEHLIYLGGPEKGMAVKLQSARRPLNELFNCHSLTTLHIVLLSIIYANALPGHPFPEGHLGAQDAFDCAAGGLEAMPTPVPSSHRSSVNKRLDPQAFSPLALFAASRTAHGTSEK